MYTNKNLTIALAVTSTLLVISVVYNIVLLQNNSDSGNVKPTPTQYPTQSPSPIAPTVIDTPIVTTEIPTGTPQTTSFSNSKLSISLKSGWSAQGLASGSVNITKGSYVLYINPSYSQASGIQGGRFDEISTGASSADLVTIFHPAVECTAPVISLSKLYKRYDVYTNGTVDQDLCKRTTDNSERWYFTYYVKESPYMTYFASGSKAYVITVSIKASTLSDLPKRNDSTLKARLSEINEMVDTLLLK